MVGVQGTTEFKIGAVEMSRRSDFGRSRIAYALDVYGPMRTRCEKQRAEKRIKAKKSAKVARRRNRK